MPKRKIFNFLFILISSILFILNTPSLTYSEQEDLSSERAQQKEDVREERKEEITRKAESAKELVELLKERAMLKIKKKRKALLLKTKTSLSALYGFETNASNASDTKGDHYHEEDFYYNWVPTFNKFLGADIGYWAINQRYFEQTDISSVDHAVNATFKLTPFESGKLRLEPGVEYEWLWYPSDENSSYENFKYFTGFKHFIGTKWNYGGKYQHEFKVYDTKKARTSSKRSLEYTREDNRHSGELYITRYIGKKYSAKVKGKAYRNSSNDNYQDYNDYDSFKGSLTLSGSFLKDDKLYLSLTPSFEWKNYKERTAMASARYDDVYTYQLSSSYNLLKPLTLTYKFTYKKVFTNYDTGRYKNITNVVGVTLDF